MILPDDRAALRAAVQPGTGLCTIVGIDGSFSRRIGAQLAVAGDGRVIGSLSDGCLERQLASEVAAARETGQAVLRRFGAGSPLIDFRLPCGSGIDIWIDPAPDHDACATAVAQLDARAEARLSLPHGSAGLADRQYIPPLRLLLFGEGPELDALATIARGAGYLVECLRSDTAQPMLSLGQAPHGVAADPWTAVVLLFHDHEWEQAILQWALATPAFFIGAQGGMDTRASRLERLAAAGQGPEQLARIHSPVGVIPRAREPGVLALSALAQIVGAYEALHPHG